MNDTQRLDWLERNPDRLAVHYNGPGRTTFSIQIEKGGGLLHGSLAEYTPPKYSSEHVTLRGALDEGMERIL